MRGNSLGTLCCSQRGLRLWVAVEQHIDRLALGDAFVFHAGMDSLPSAERCRASGCCCTRVSFPGSFPRAFAWAIPSAGNARRVYVPSVEVHLPEIQPGMENPHPPRFYTGSLTSPLGLCRQYGRDHRGLAHITARRPYRMGDLLTPPLPIGLWRRWFPSQRNPRRGDGMVLRPRKHGAKRQRPTQGRLAVMGTVQHRTKATS